MELHSELVGKIEVNAVSGGIKKYKNGVQKIYLLPDVGAMPGYDREHCLKNSRFLRRTLFAP